MSKMGRMHANGAFGKTPAPTPRAVYTRDSLDDLAARLPCEQWAEHTVVVAPRPDGEASNVGVVWRSPDSSLLGAVLMRPGSADGLNCDSRALDELRRAGAVEPPAPE
jgi:hypothetical protein